LNMASCYLSRPLLLMVLLWIFWRRFFKEHNLSKIYSTLLGKPSLIL
jgi:hypothetical protein